MQKPTGMDNNSEEWTVVKRRGQANKRQKFRPEMEHETNTKYGER